MKRFFAVGLLSGVLIFLLASCTDKTDEIESSMLYGQVTGIDETTVTVERGNYGSKGEFKSLGKEAVYSLPEAAFYDDFKPGDLVAVFFERSDATLIVDADKVIGETAGVTVEAESPDLSAVKVIDGTKDIWDSDVYETKTADRSVILAKNGGRLTIDGGVINKRGNSSDTEASILHGLNAAVAVTSGAQVETNDVTVKSHDEGAGGLLVKGVGSKLSPYRSGVNTVGDLSPALVALDGGMIEAEDMAITTLGEDSPCIYSSGNISLVNSTASSSKSSAVVIKDKNCVFLKGCNLTGAGESGIQIHGEADSATNVGEGASEKSSSGEASTRGKFISQNSEIENKSAGAMFSVVGTYAVATLTDTRLSFSSGVLTAVTGATGDENSNDTGAGGKFILKGQGQQFTGEIRCDAASKVKLILVEGSTFTGAMDTDDTAGYSKVYLSKDSDWNLTANSHVSSLGNERKSCDNIKSNGYNIYYDADNPANAWLEGESTELPGGGQLTPSASSESR